MVVVILALVISGFTISLAATNCPPLHYRNRTSCVPCKKCSMGFGVEMPCTEKDNTVCQPCWPQYDYSNSTGFDPCIPCDQNSNCLAGNPKVIKNCTIFSDKVCNGCAEGYYFEKNAGESGGCIECSPPCGVFEIEERPCVTQHNRVCTRDIPEPTCEYSEADETIPHSGETPIHTKSWFWPVVCTATVVIIAPFAVVTAIKCRNHKRRTGRRNTRPASVLQFTQQSIPLMSRDCLDLPIKDLSVEQKRFISHLLNDKDNLEYCYWYRVAERVGLGNEAKAWGRLKNPTEAFLTAYGEKRDSTVRSLINALKEDELTHFASRVEERFFTARDHVHTSRVNATHV